VAHAQLAALHVTLPVTLAGFFLFASFPVAMQWAYGWVPRVRSWARRVEDRSNPPDARRAAQVDDAAFPDPRRARACLAHYHV